VQQDHHIKTGMPATLRIIVCGTVDEGKSPLVERLLAHRNERRAIIVTELRAENQSTHDLIDAASNAEIAILLVDAGKGLVSQTRYQAIIAHLCGIRHLVLAVDGIDRVRFDRAPFDAISQSFVGFAGELGFAEIGFIPLSARDGDNISQPSTRMLWHTGPTLLEYLETVDVADERKAKPFRMAVQSVDASAAGFAGTLASGSLQPGDDVVVLPAGRTGKVKTLIGASGELKSAQAGDTVTITLTEKIATAPGDMVAALRDRPQVADQFAAHLIWLSNDRLLPERSYLMKINNCELNATVTNLNHRIDVDSLAKLAAKTLGSNEIGVCNLAVAHPVAFDPRADNHGTDAFILVDRYSNETVGIGMVDFALRRATNVHYQTITVSKAARAALMPHRPALLWFTGLPGAGKSTISNLVEAALHKRGAHTLLLDGDNIRLGLNRDLGFTEVDRVENIRRIGEVAKLMIDAGLIVLCSFISPFRAERRMVRELVEYGEFIEIFVDTPLVECIARDPKGLYRRALAGEIKNFTGVDQAYETPEHAEIRLDAGHGDPQALAQAVIEDLVNRKIL
jgi:bifunctional enzyme CysN/CysC